MNKKKMVFTPLSEKNNATEYSYDITDKLTDKLIRPWNKTVIISYYDCIYDIVLGDERWCLSY